MVQVMLGLLWMIMFMSLSVWADTNKTSGNNNDAKGYPPKGELHPFNSSSAQYSTSHDAGLNKTPDTQQSHLISLRYAQAKQIKDILQKSKLLSSGRVVSDPRTNTLWIQAKPKVLTKVKRLVHKLDRAVSQVMIKAYVVSVDANAIDELGLQFHTSTLTSQKAQGMNMDMPKVSTNTGQFDLKVAQLGFGQFLDVQISALASEGKGKIISSPELVAANHQSAYIATGAKIPFQEKTAYGNTSVNFKKAVLSLKVTPQLLKDQSLLLHLHVKQDAVSNLDVKGVPIIDTREIQTQARVNHGKTLVLGGIYEQSRTRRVQRIPYLSALPGIGKLFQHWQKRSKRKELLIFVTPYVLCNQPKQVSVKNST